MRWLALLGMAFALVAAGCGGGDEESAPSEETTIEELLKEVTTPIPAPTPMRTTTSAGRY